VGGAAREVGAVSAAWSSAAPAGWPEDVVEETGRVSAAEVAAADENAGKARSTNRRRRVPVPRRPTGRPAVPDPPPSWPGRLPAPSPATVPPQPLPAELVDATGAPVRLTAPDLLSAPPHRLVVDDGNPQMVQGWAGPWPLHQRWWVGEGASSRLQVAVDGGVALLLLAREGRWWVTGIYD
jgi:protein ImuB